MLTTEDYNIMRRCAATHRPYKAYVELCLTDLFSMDGVEDLEDKLSIRATNSQELDIISWRIVDFKLQDTVIIEVLGDVSEVVKELDGLAIQEVQ